MMTIDYNGSARVKGWTTLYFDLQDTSNYGKNSSFLIGIFRIYFHLAWIKISASSGGSVLGSIKCSSWYLVVLILHPRI